MIADRVTSPARQGQCRASTRRRPGPLLASSISRAPFESCCRQPAVNRHRATAA